MLVDIGGGQTVAVDVTAGEDPPVVFVAQIGTAGTSWQPVVDLLTTRPTVVTYDRPGIGASPPRPAPNPPQPYSRWGDELAAMLDAIRITRPVVLVGHSIGGLVVRSFAGRHPHRAAGLVLVDGSVPSLSLRPGDGPYSDGDGPDATQFDTAAGKAEILATPLRPMPAAVIVRTPGWWPPQWTEPFNPDVDRLWQESAAEVAHDLGVPLIVAADAGHQVPREAPQLVASAVDEVVRAVRGGRGALTCPLP